VTLVTSLTLDRSDVLAVRSGEGLAHLAGNAGRPVGGVVVGAGPGHDLGPGARLLEQGGADGGVAEVLPGAARNPFGRPNRPERGGQRPPDRSESSRGLPDVMTQRRAHVAHVARVWCVRQRGRGAMRGANGFSSISGAERAPALPLRRGQGRVRPREINFAGLVSAQR